MFLSLGQVWALSLGEGRAKRVIIIKCDNFFANHLLLRITQIVRGLCFKEQPLLLKSPAKDEWIKKWEEEWEKNGKKNGLKNPKRLKPTI